MNTRTVFERYRHSRFFGNTSWIMAERVFQMLISLIVGMMSARYLGPTNYGVINYVAAFIAFGVPICGLGFERVLIKAYVDDRRKAGDAIGTAILFEFVTSVVMSFVIVTIVYLSHAADEVKTAVAILESFLLLFKCAEPIEFWYTSQLRSKYTSIVRIFAYSVMAAYRVILIVQGRSVVWFAFATSIDTVVMGILFIILYLHQDNPGLGIDIAYGKELLGSSYHFIISDLMGVAYSQMDKIMLRNMIGDRDVGLYSAAYAICSMWFFVPAAVISSATPVILQAKNNDEKMYHRRLSQLYCAIFWFGVFVALVVTVFSALIIRLLYGNEYVGAAGSLSIGIWYGVFAQLGVARGVWILAENMNRYVKYYLIWGAVVNLVLNYVLIRPLGINGAAFATLLTQIFTSLLAPMMYKETRIHTKIVLDAICFGWRR